MLKRVAVVLSIAALVVVISEPRSTVHSTVMTDAELAMVNENANADDLQGEKKGGNRLVKVVTYPFKAIGRLFRSVYPDLWWQIDDLIAEGDKVVARTTMSGTHSGDFFGIAPTGRRVSVVGVHVFRIQDGKVAEHWGSNDDLSLMRQLGVIPA